MISVCCNYTELPVRPVKQHKRSPELHKCVPDNGGLLALTWEVCGFDIREAKQGGNSLAVAGAELGRCHIFQKEGVKS